MKKTRHLFFSIAVIGSLLLFMLHLVPPVFFHALAANHHDTEHRNIPSDAGSQISTIHTHCDYHNQETTPSEALHISLYSPAVALNFQYLIVEQNPVFLYSTSSVFLRGPPLV